MNGKIEISSATLLKIRASIVDGIVDLMHKHECTEVSTCLCDAPILIDDPHDGNLSYTLDEVILDNGMVDFRGSSCCDNAHLNQGDIGLEELMYIYEWLLDNEDEIFDFDDN